MDGNWKDLSKNVDISADAAAIYATTSVRRYTLPWQTNCNRHTDW